MTVPSFVDCVKLIMRVGNDDHGCAPVHREKFRPLGRPDSSDGDDGGSVILRVVDNLSSLVEYRYQPVHRVTNGQPGHGDHQYGAKGEDVVLAVPAGTVVFGATTGKHLTDLTGSGEEYITAVGGKSGLGNEALATAAHKAPGFVLPGEEGESRLIQFELKMLADTDLIGFPSAGKSLLIVTIPRVRPRIADYPFTTLMPNLGVVVAGDLTCIVVDVPGLTEGASLGKGLRSGFLRHIERCQAIVRIIDLGTWGPGHRPVAGLGVIEGKLAAHSDLGDRGYPVVLNKLDLPNASDFVKLTRLELEKCGYQVFEVGTKTGKRLNALKLAVAQIVETHRTTKVTEEPPKKVLRSKPAGRIATDNSFTTVKKGDGEGSLPWRARGVKPEHWVRQAGSNNTEAVGYLADRSNWLGMGEKLLGLGTREGDAVAVGGDDAAAFDLVLQVEIRTKILSRRDRDPRLESRRSTVAWRRRIDVEYHAQKAGGVVDEG